MRNFFMSVLVLLFSSSTSTKSGVSKYDTKKRAAYPKGQALLGIRIAFFAFGGIIFLIGARLLFLK